MTDEMPEEVFIDKDYPETGHNKFSLKNKYHRAMYVLKKDEPIEEGDLASALRAVNDALTDDGCFINADGVSYRLLSAKQMRTLRRMAK